LSPVLVVDGLSKRLGDRVILSDVDLVVRPGEKVVVLGRNGAGKSTLLKVITGVWRPSAGRVLVDGMPPSSRIGRLRFGAVFQDATVDPFSTVGDTLALHGVLYGLNRRQLRERIPEVLAMVDLDGVERRETRRLSGGQLRRLELARCLLHNAALIVLDEPTTGLDPLARKAIWSVVDSLRRRHALAVLFTTHHAEELAGCDRSYQLRGGRLESDSAPDDRTFAAAFAD
jgi:ABC-type multidrug transport system ATPase subunit